MYFFIYQFGFTVNLKSIVISKKWIDYAAEELKFVKENKFDLRIKTKPYKNNYITEFRKKYKEFVKLASTNKFKINNM